MRTIRRLLCSFSGRAVTLALTLATLWTTVGPDNYLYALEVERKKEAQIREIARKMNVDPEFLLHPGDRPGDRRSFDLAALFGFTSTSQEVSPQSEGVKAQIARVKSRYALVAADTTLAKIAELIEIALAPENTRHKKKGQIKAELHSVLRLIDKDFLPPLEEGLPGLASSRDAQMRAAVGRMRQDVKAILNAPRALEEKNIDATLASVRQSLSGSLRLRGNGQPRWTRDPFPIKDSYRKAPTSTTDRRYGAASSGGNSSTTPAVVSNAAPPRATSARVATNAVASDVAALATQLGTPAKVFAYVYDRIDWESYGGVAKGARGTLQERRGNDWDQALLLRDLLIAQGYPAQLEWGKVDLPIARAMNLAGTEDPTMAGNLLATAGFDAVTLVQNGAPVAIRMTHAWVRAFIPYIPNRGTTPGLADTWVRMDPSFKRYDYQPGIEVDVPWNESEYLQTSAVRPPNDHYADKIWAFIRANNLNCNNLAQVPKTGRIRAANYPFIPATLNTRVEQFIGVAAEPPASLMQTVSLTVIDPYRGDLLVSWSGNFADEWGKKVSIAFPPASADDAAIIARYGSLYDTPAYLVRLKAVVSIDDQPVAEGGSVAPGVDLSLDLSFREPRGTDGARHDIAAGETMVEVFDSGRAPDSLIQERMARLQAIAAQPASDAQREALLTEKLAITGLRYFQEVDDGIDFAAGTQWHRWVKSTFEGLVSQRLAVTYNFIGQAIRVSPADRNIDVTRMALGIIPIRSDLSERLDAIALSGLHSSYLEGAIWEEVEAQQGISATKALLLSRLAGQTIRTADRTNVESVLAATNLPPETESNIRGAVAQGRIAVIPSANIRVNRWVGTGYILRDPLTGSATYPISGGFAGGSSTGAGTSGTADIKGTEWWLGISPISEIMAQFMPNRRASGSPSTTQSDPVNVATGNMYRTDTDFAVQARGLPIVLARTYNSRSTDNGTFGFGWTFSYGESLTPNAGGSVTYVEADGTEHRFALAGGQYVAPPGKHLTLTAVPDGGWSLRSKDGLELSFDARGLLVAQTDLNDNRVTINRDAAGLPSTIVDAVGRTILTFTIAAGKIVEVSDLTGRKATYGYDGDDLVSVTDTSGKTWTMSYDLAHNMTSYGDPLGNTQSYDYDADDRLMHHVDAVGAEEYFHYDIAGRHSVITDKRGGDRLVQYDDLGRATAEVDPAGNMVMATFDTDNNRTAVIDSRGNATTYEHDAGGNVTRQVNPDGGVITTTNGPNARPLTTTDAVGATTVLTYDASGNVLESRKSVNGVVEVTTHTYDSAGQRLTTTDPNGGTSSMTWSDNGMLATQTDPASNTTTTITDPLGRITSIKDPASHESLLTYDGRDRLLTFTDPHGVATTITYDAAGRQTAVTTPRGTTRHTYDGEGRVLTTVDNLGHTSSTRYDAAGDVIAQTDARGNTTRFELDPVGRVTKKIDATGGVWIYGYCAAIGSSCSSCGSAGSSFCDLVDPNGNGLKRDFDVMGRTMSVADSLGNAMRMEYDKAGRKIAATDARGNVTRYSYDESGRLLTITEASGGGTAYKYDKNGNRIEHKNPNGSTWSFKYDPANRLIEEKDPLGRTTTYTYDALGQIATKRDGKGQTVTYTYNVRRLVKAAYPDGSADTWGYDAVGRQTSVANANVTLAFAYDALDRVTTITNQRYNLVNRYEYDAEGNAVKLTTPRSTVSYTYDARNRLSVISDTLFGVFRLGYDAMSRRTELQYPNGITTSYAYDKAYRMTAMVAKDSTGAIVDAWSYQYDATGNRTSKTDLTGKSDTYTYDEVHRLANANYADGSFEKFTYDKAGNRLTLVSEAATTTYSYDVANQLLSAGGETFTYDGNGNRVTRTDSRGTTTYAYDFMNRLTRAAGPDGTETNLYAADGSRVDLAGTPMENGQVRVLHDLAGNPILDWGSDNQTWTYRLYGPGLDEPLAEWRRANNRISYMHLDALRSVTAVTNTSGQVLYRASYKAFGKMSRTADPQNIVQTRLGYTSRESSVGDLMHYRSRHYDAASGMFLQQDSFRGDDSVPPSLHRYTYTHNNPVRYTDPTGHHIFVLLAGILFWVGFAIGLSLRSLLWGTGMQRTLDHGGGSAAEGFMMAWRIILGFAIVSFSGLLAAFLIAFSACVALGIAFEIAGHGFNWVSDEWEDIRVDAIGCFIGVLIGLLITQLIFFLPLPGLMLGVFAVGVALGYLTTAVYTRIR